MTKATPSNDVCQYQVADWGQEPRQCGNRAKKVALPEEGEPFYYCGKHFSKAESFLTSRHVPVSDV